MASFKAKFPFLQELFAKKHRGPFAPPPLSGARVKPVCIANIVKQYPTITTYRIQVWFGFDWGTKTKHIQSLH